jgi:predicted GNAT family N-acyltransferase
MTKQDDGALRSLVTVAVIEDSGTRQRMLGWLADLLACGRLAAEIPQFHIETTICRSQAEALDCVSTNLRSAEPRAVILLSDVLVECDNGPQPNWKTTYWGKDVRQHADANGNQGGVYAAVAICSFTGMVCDIDRVIAPDCDAEALLSALSKVTKKLVYLARPTSTDLTYPVVVRPIRTQAELAEYFRLRHLVYTPMTYLSPRVEQAESRMELDWCDTTSLHIGAFEHAGGKQKLIGTARVVSTGEVNPQYATWTRQLAHPDHGLRLHLKLTRLPLKLPIFHSMKLPSLTDAFNGMVAELHAYGELSRVIVAAEYRGAGLAHVLIRYALAHARRSGIETLFLECLPIHEPLYRRFGFQQIAGAEGDVIGVKKTMIGMELDFARSPDPRAPVDGCQPEDAAERIIQERDHLCACQRRGCFTGGYGSYGTPDCPLRRF